MFKTVETEQLITATGGFAMTSGFRPPPPSSINIKPPVWPRRVDGHRASVLPANPSGPHIGF
jgi:hypothetical protein